MKQKSFLSLCMVSLCLTLSSVLTAQTLKPYYFDLPNADVQRLAQMTDNVASFFSCYEHAMEKVNEGADMSKYFIVETAENAADSVSHLLGDIIYDQGTPFNNLCPMINGRRAVTGCVATAMAQVMRYYSFPNVGVGEVTYTGNNGAKTINLADYRFDWDLILNDYTKSYTSEQAEAVAKLMLACGASLNMNYSADGSSSQIDKAMKALKDHFGYSKDIAYYDSTNDYDPEGLIEYDWAPTIREQHKNGYPVFYAGHAAAGVTGHAFIIDGYKVIDGIYYYHVNWGWSGAFNGYYLILNLKPEDANYAGYGSNMVINAFPEGWTDVDNVEIENNKLDLNKPIYTILGTRVAPSQLKHGNLYIQQGKKVLY